jgi:molybdopterin-guanine dinucleotide biosynthesis protein A
VGGQFTIGAAILAGGRATRLGGKLKGLIQLPSGETIIEQLLAEFALAGFPNPIICSAGHTEYACTGKVLVPDQVPGIGPMGGIAVALGYYSGRTDAVLFSPCDMPKLTASELTRLVDEFQATTAQIVVAETCQKALHPLCSVVHIDVLAAVGEAITAQRFSVHQLWRKLNAIAVGFTGQGAFTNLNTPADFI